MAYIQIEETGEAADLGWDGTTQEIVFIDFPTKFRRIHKTQKDDFLTLEIQNNIVVFQKRYMH